MSKRKKETESESAESSQSEVESVADEDSGSEEEEEEEKKPQKKKVEKKKAAAKAKPKKKRKKDPKAPKKPTTAYAFFLKAKKNEFQAQYPDLKYPEITKKISVAWKALDPEAKKEYMELYEQDRKRYSKAMENYKKPSTESEESSEESSKKKKKKKKKVVKRKDPNAPKQATNAYMYFQREQREQIKKDNPSLKTLPQVAKKMGEIWGKMTDEEKKPYAEMASKDKQRYEVENKSYKEKQEKEKKEKEDKEREKKAKEKAKEKAKDDDDEDDSEDNEEGDEDDDEEDDD